MPLYEYRCLSCDDVFEARRAMADADAAITCPDGHADVKRLLAVFATSGRATQSTAPAPAASAPMGGCGAGCGCH